MYHNLIVILILYTIMKYHPKIILKISTDKIKAIVKNFHKIARIERPCAYNICLYLFQVFCLVPVLLMLYTRFMYVYRVSICCEVNIILDLFFLFLFISVLLLVVDLLVLYIAYTIHSLHRSDQNSSHECCRYNPHL
jgi:hypothetical protein